MEQPERPPASGRRNPIPLVERLVNVEGRPWSEVTQTILHDPENELVNGNCLQACVASMLNLPIEAVPHFSQYLWWPQAMSLWLRGRSLITVGERTTTVPERLSIVGGKSARGVAHVVIGYQGEIVWDPHPSRDGLVSITDATWFEPWDGEYGQTCWFCSNEWAEMQVEAVTEVMEDADA